MFKDIKTILFTTNLTRNCVPAFDVAVMLALKFQAKIVLLHVLEKIPDYVEGRLAGLLGQEPWEEMLHSHETEVRQQLIGKRSSSKLVRKALEHFCTEAGIDAVSCGHQSREVVIGDGDVVESIIDNSKQHACDLIIMGGHEGYLLTTSIGATIKSVLRKSKLPVLVVPADPDGDSKTPDGSGWRR
jgi:nucleotide-binding universal stress UspA family protein